MSKYETYSLILTITAWVVLLITQVFILSRQKAVQQEIAELQNRLGARREIASTHLENLSLMANWLEEGLEIQSNAKKIETFLDNRDGYFNDPNPDISKIVTQIQAWSNSSKKLISLAQIYDPIAEENTSEWSSQFDGKLPKDLPRLLEFFDRFLIDFVWKQIYEYQESGKDFQMPPDENMYIPMPDVGKYIIPTYKETQIALDRVREFVATNPLLPRR